MARKLWVVVVEDFDHMIQHDMYRDQYVSSDRDPNIMSVFLRKTSADQAARDLAMRHPGKDVHVFEQTYGFTAPARPVESKIWTEDGNFIPGTPT